MSETDNIKRSKAVPPGSSSRLAATPETDAYVYRVSETKATWDTIEQWSTACMLMSNHSRKMERHRDRLAAGLREALALLNHSDTSYIQHEGWWSQERKAELEALITENDLAQTRRAGD